MGGEDDLQELLAGDRKYATLYDVFKACVDTVKRSNSSGGGRLDQLVRTAESIHDTGRSLKVSIFPADVELEYDSRAVDDDDKVVVSIDDAPSRVPTLAHPSDSPTCVRERISVRGSSTSSREFVNEYVMEPDGTIHGDGVGDMTGDVMSAYLDVLFEQVISYFGAEGVINPTAGNMDIPNIRRRISLSHVENFMDSKGEPYSIDRFMKRIVDAASESCLKVGQVRYDRLYLYGTSLLIDCGGHDLIKDAVPEGGEDVAALDAGLREAFSGNLDRMCIYEHADAAITLVDRVFPDSGDVFMYPLVEGVVKRLFNCYALRPNPSARVDSGWLVFDDRDLRIQFLGSIGEAEFREQAAEYVRQRPSLEASRMVAGILGYR